MQCIVKSFNTYTKIAQLWVQDALPSLQTIARHNDVTKGVLVRAIVKNPSSLLSENTNITCDLVSVNYEDEECTVNIQKTRPTSFPHHRVPVLQVHELQEGNYYKQVLGYKVNNVYVMAPYGTPGYNREYKLETPCWGGKYMGIDENNKPIFKLNTNIITHYDEDPHTVYVLKYNNETQHVAWIKLSKRQFYDGPHIVYFDHFQATMCYVACAPPNQEDQIVIRGPLHKGHIYGTCIGHRTERWPDELHYATTPITYLGKYVGKERYGFGDGGSAFELFEGSDGKIIKHELNYEGTTCFMEMSAPF